MKKIKYIAVCLALVITSVLLPSCSNKSEGKEIVLRVCNWEEYIDLGDWDDDETIELESKDILGANKLYEDFEEWYYDKYNVKVRVEYSTFGTNEDLYNQLTLGDEYDLVCPSDYMIMKLIAEDKVVPLSDEFFDKSNPDNYYINGVSPYINDVFNSYEINSHKWAEYAAGYMWGTVGFVYNPEKVEKQDVSSWDILLNEKYARQVTIKDNVRDAYFPVLGIMNSDLLKSDEFKNSKDYEQNLFEVMNDTSPATVDKAEKMLKQIKDNVYSFETDSGKNDMVTGKVVANLQWSGDAVYTIEQAAQDGVDLCYAVPEECTNLWFDGFIMLKDGIKGDKTKQKVAESFINYLSMPESVIRNMYYIGYTSAISGGDSDLIYEYVNYLFESDDENAVEYPVGYFFSGDNSDEKYVIKTDESQLDSSLFAFYPTQEVIKRSAVMNYFDEQANKRINQMWINVRCFSFGK